MGYLESIVYTNGLFVAVGTNGHIFTSTKRCAMDATSNREQRRIRKHHLRARPIHRCGDRGTIMTSSNAINWVEHRFLTGTRFAKSSMRVARSGAWATMKRLLNPASFSLT
jgi:hypothetical protein